jgi:hypothetical protein
MTEEQWLACADPGSMLDFLCDGASDRKMRLFAVACCGVYRKWFTDERSWAAVEVASRAADGRASEDERVQAFLEAYSAANWSYESDPAAVVAAYTCGYRSQMAEVPSRMLRAFAFDINVNPERVGCGLVKDIFGNPFRPVRFVPKWRTDDVLGLARGIYEERAFDRLPLLGDALMDAGCDQEEILAHCRSDGPHARGCWVVDLVLGKD